MISFYQEVTLERIMEKLINTRDDLSNCICDKAKKSITECVESINNFIEDEKE